MVVVQHNRSKTALDKMPRPPPSCVDEVGVAPMGFANRQTETFSMRGNQDQMNMVRHQAVSPHLHPMFFCLLAEQIEINRLIARIKEDGLAPVPTLCDVMSASSNHDPRKPRPASESIRK